MRAVPFAPGGQEDDDKLQELRTAGSPACAEFSPLNDSVEALK